MQEEIFGPVCAIAKFDTEEEVLKLGNDTMYGLAAAVHTKDLNTAIRVSNALHAGTVWVNCYKFVHLFPTLEKTLLTSCAVFCIMLSHSAQVNPSPAP